MGAEPFQTPAWFRLLAAHGLEHPPQSLPCLSLPPDAQGRSSTLHFMHAGPGQPLTSLSTYYSALYGPAGEGGAEPSLTPEQWAQQVQALRELPGSAVLRLQPLDAQSPWLAGLEQGLNASAYATDRFFCFGNRFQPVDPGGFAAYWAARPSALRHSVARGRRRLDKAGAWRIDIVEGAGPALQDALEAYLSVYARSWKAPEPCPGFMPALVRTAAAQGWLRLGVLWLDGEPLAAQVWLVHAGKANIYKLAYVHGQEKRSVGSVLTAGLMQHVMDTDRVQEIDYLSGDDAYKADWMAQRRERLGLLAFDQRRLQGRLALARHRLQRFIRPSSL